MIEKLERGVIRTDQTAIVDKINGIVDWINITHFEDGPFLGPKEHTMRVSHRPKARLVPDMSDSHCPVCYKLVGWSTASYCSNCGASRADFLAGIPIPVNKEDL